MVGAQKSKQFLEIDLKKTHVISATESQGRFGNGLGKEYAESYTLEYWRPGINTWYTYKRWNGDKVSTMQLAVQVRAFFNVNL